MKRNTVLYKVLFEPVPTQKVAAANLNSCVLSANRSRRHALNVDSFDKVESSDHNNAVWTDGLNSRQHSFQPTSFRQYSVQYSIIFTPPHSVTKQFRINGHAYPCPRHLSHPGHGIIHRGPLSRLGPQKQATDEQIMQLTGSTPSHMCVCLCVNAPRHRQPPCSRVPRPPASGYSVSPQTRAPLSSLWPRLCLHGHVSQGPDSQGRIAARCPARRHSCPRQASRKTRIHGEHRRLGLHPRWRLAHRVGPKKMMGAWHLA